MPADPPGRQLCRLAGQRPPLSCRTSPPRGGRSAIFRRLRQSQRRKEGGALELLISPLVGEMSGRTEGGAVGRDLCEKSNDPTLRHDHHRR
ncbi:hypothetical protein B5V01_24820 [Mesorhizobium erdmanii]|uniref:Propionyl-coenzyme A carboxylase alpha polypeptide n=1 Tax=Mesorhizobium erdmanii TaxID=1777866 RepID=A0A4Q1URW1_9HYPH|nr:hypothetical protein B5V01_24820 [Mesorhizobium erdmanii]